LEALHIPFGSRADTLDERAFVREARRCEKHSFKHFGTRHATPKEIGGRLEATAVPPGFS
jgi:hypothetical protein